ncbi:hypothetical protein [Thiolapillus sp.]
MRLPITDAQQIRQEVVSRVNGSARGGDVDLMVVLRRGKADRGCL